MGTSGRKDEVGGSERGRVRGGDGGGPCNTPNESAEGLKSGSVLKSASGLRLMSISRLPFMLSGLESESEGDLTGGG